MLGFELFIHVNLNLVLLLEKQVKQNYANKLISSKILKGYIENTEFDFKNKLYISEEDYGVHILTSHPNFTSSFTDEFYYSCIDEASPFGNNSGSDALCLLEEMICKDKIQILIVFLNY